MWRGYGNNGQGASLSISSFELDEIIDEVPNLHLVDVLYEDYQKEFFIKSLFRLAHDSWRKIDNSSSTSYILEKIIENKYGETTQDEIVEAFSIAFQCIPSFFKHEGFSEEREVRLIYIPEIHTRNDTRVDFIGSGHNARPYINFSKLVKTRKKTLLPIIEITFGPDVCDQAYRDDFLLTGGQAAAQRKDIQEKYSRIPYRSR